jgi:hypothetical protein
MLKIKHGSARGQLITGAAVAVGTLAYFFFQGHSLIMGPSISLTKPQPYETVPTRMLVEGSAKRAKILTVNGLQVPVSPDGTFETTIVPPVGYTVLTVQATDQFGKTTTLEVPLAH